MATIRHLRNAPITEALIDIRVRLSSGFDPKEFLNLSGELCNTYPKNEPRRLITGSFGMKDGKPIIEPPEDRGIQGYFFKSEDERNIAQFRLDGFTLNHLQPYTKWEDVLSEAKKLWKLYSSICSPDLPNRIAVRYINRLEIPLPIIDFGEYLTAPPRIPESLPQEISQFLNRVVIREGERVVNLMQAMEPSTDRERIVIILDIDAFISRELGFDERNIWVELEKLRELKNRVFFESITEKTARLYE